MCFTVWLSMSEYTDFRKWMTDGMLAYQMEDRYEKMYKRDCPHREEAQRIRGRSKTGTNG